MTEREALMLALEAFKKCAYLKLQPDAVQQICDTAITAIKEALARRTWVGLTDDDIKGLTAKQNPNLVEVTLCRAVDGLLKEKNT